MHQSFIFTQATTLIKMTSSHFSCFTTWTHPITPNHIPSQSTTHITLSSKVINPEIATVLDSRKIGWCYEYLIHWKQSPDSENSWTPFAKIPTMLYFILEQFHCWNPTPPHPPQFLITSDYSTTVNAPSSDIWPPTPPVESWSQTTNYKPPSTTVTCTGCHVHPPKQSDTSS